MASRGRRMMIFGTQMPEAFDVRLTGLEELEVKLKALPEDMKYKGGRAALRRGANIVRDAAMLNAAGVDNPETRQSIAKNIVVRWSSRTFKRTGDLGFRIGVLGGARQDSQAYKDLGVYKGKGKDNPGGDTFYWRFLEFGTEHSRAMPFMRRALSDNAQKVTDEFIKQYGKAIDRILKKAAKGK